MESEKEDLPFVVRWRNAVLSESGPEKAMTRYVLVVLSTYMLPDGTRCFPSTRSIARDSGLSERAVCHHLALGATAGWIVKTSRQARGREWRSHLYIPIIASGTDRESVPNAPGTDAESVTHERGTDSHDAGALTLTHRGTDRESVEETIEQTSEQKGAAQGRRPRSRSTQIPNAFEPDATCRTKADELGVDLAGELEKFTNHAKANGRTAKDWQAALRNWLIKAREFDRSRPAPGRASQRSVSASDHKLSGYE